MTRRAVLGACIVAAVAASGLLVRPAHVQAAAVQQPPGQPVPATGALDDDVTIQAFLTDLEAVVKSGDPDAFMAMEGPLGDREDALAFARAEFRPGATRVTIQERDRQELTLSGIPGGGYALTIDAFIEFGRQARVTTWQFYVRRFGDSWGIVRQQVISSVDNLYRLELNTAKQFDVRNLAITSEDLELTLTEGSAFTIETDQGLTGLVLVGRGDMRFAPTPDNEKGQVRIFSGSEVLETRFDAAFVRVGTAELHFDPAALVPRATVDAGDAKKATRIFREESPKSFAVDLADLTRDPWTLLPGADDFLAEVRTRRFNTLTYARSASEPEDISLFERRRHRNIALYASKQKLASRGRFYNEDDLAPFDVLDYDIDVTALPDRAWVEGRTRMRLRVRAASLGQLTMKLADTLVVRSIVSDKFGRLFNLRVTNQNTVLINLPSLLVQDAELTLAVTYSGRLEPQSPDRETLTVEQDDPGNGPQTSFPDDVSLPRAEPSFLYSNRSFWYPQSTVSDYATATIRLTVPTVYGCVATGELTGPPVPLEDRDGVDGRKTYTFRADQPARYLSFVVSRFVRAETMDVALSAEHDPSTESGVEPADPPTMNLTIEANPRQTRQGRQLTTRAADILRFYSSVVGDTPYPSFTIALVENTLPGGHSPAYFAELNQPLPNSPLVWRNDPAAFENYPEFFMAHEIAHQWWGHGVGWQNYHEQWLSEGFSQYFAALYASQYRGDEVFQGILKRMRRWAMNESDQGPVYLGYRIGHIRNDGRAFRAIIYNKGAMVLHMLRLMVGDDAFFSGLRRFYVGARFRKVGTEDFRLAMEQESGKDLRRFFERWIYNASLPQITFDYQVVRSGDAQVAMLQFEQQTSDIFDLPAIVTLDYADGRSTDVVVSITDRVAEIPVTLDGALRSASISKKDVSLVDFK